MRIIAGKYRGHHLVNFKANHIRPTTDRVKETMFNKWMGYLEDATVLDLFCGTGNLGLEALSRGAKHVTFVDSHKTSLKITQENIEKLKIPKEQYTIVLKDVFTFVKQWSKEPFDLIFVDPPFTEKIAHDVMEAISKSKAFAPHTRIALESQAKERLELEYSPLTCYDQNLYGDKKLSLFIESGHEEEGDLSGKL
ncbi:MAG: 16S rRNA (guanine(966)-N(2))-methyltransferase RsmD [Bdellovibrionota bacterium]